MPNSLRVKFNSMRYKGRIDEAEYQALIKKLNGHDCALLDKVADKIKDYSYEIDTELPPYTDRIVELRDIDLIIEEMKAEVKNDD